MAQWKISHTHTLDGVLVEPGLRAWDYDLRRVIVDKARPYKEGNGDQWWDTIYVETGERGHMMNPSRLWVRHPSTGEPA